MARYEVVGPDGHRYEVSGPDGASDLEVLAQIHAADPPKSATTQDRAQAAAAGVNKGALTALPGIPVDTALNVADLVRAGYGFVGNKLGMLKAADMPEPLDRKGYVGSSAWLQEQMRNAGAGRTIDPNRPDDTASRVLHSGGVAVGSSMAPGFKYTGPAQIAKDASMAAGAGVAGQTAAENSDNPALPVLASFMPQVGTVAASATPRGIVRGRDAAGMQERLRVLNDAGVDAPSVGLAAGTRRAQFLDSVLSKLPGSGGVYSKLSERLQDNMGGRVNELRDTLSPVYGPEAAGIAMQNAIKGEGGYKDRFNALYGRKDDAAMQYIPQDAKYPASNALGAAQRITEPIQGAENLSGLLQTPRMPGINSALKADAAPVPPQIVASGLLGANGRPLTTTTPGSPGGVPYDALARLSTKIGKEASSRAIVGTPEQGDFKQLYGALAADKMAAAAASGNPKAAPALADANAFYSAGRKQLDTLQPFVNQTSPERTYGMLESAVKNTPSLAQSVTGSLKGNVRDVAGATLIDRMGKATPGNQNAAGDQFSSTTFLSNWSKLDGKAKGSVIRDPQVRADLESVAKAAEMVREGAKVLANPSGTAVTMLNTGTAMSGATALALGNAPAAATIFGGQAAAFITAKMLNNPTVVRWLAQTTKLPSDRIPQHLARLAANANSIKDPETRMDAEIYLAALRKENAK
jgi:hypothetical protein